MAESILSSFSSVSASDIISWMKTGESFSLSGRLYYTSSHERNSNAIAYLLQFTCNKGTNPPTTGMFIVPNVVMTISYFIYDSLTFEIDESTIQIIGASASGTSITFTGFFTEILP